MSKTAARFTLADVARAVRAAKEQGAEAVEILPNGTIRVIIAGVQHKDEAKPEAKRNFRDQHRERTVQVGDSARAGLTVAIRSRASPARGTTAATMTGILPGPSS